MHTLRPDENTAHSVFSRELLPILAINSGETIRFESILDASWNYYDAVAGELKRSPLAETKNARGHALIGPVYISGAEAGDVLEINIGEIKVDRMGWNIGGGIRQWDHFQKLGVSDGKEPYRVYWQLDPEAGTGRNPLGQTVKLAPFLGVLGMPPNEQGEHHTAPPRFCGGNIDCKLLTSGTTLYLPITIEGGLFSAGDGHAAQGDGEVSGTAIEAPMQHANLTLTLHKDMELKTPRANTHAGWVTLGFHDDLNEAMYIALNAMLDWMMEHYDMSRKDALSLASVVVDLRVTQVVNGVQGVHAVLPHDAISV